MVNTQKINEENNMNTQKTDRQKWEAQQRKIMRKEIRTLRNEWNEHIKNNKTIFNDELTEEQQVAIAEFRKLVRA
jgi:hypothetical protein